MNTELLKKICKIPGAPGFEQRVREFLYEELEGIVD